MNLQAMEVPGATSEPAEDESSVQWEELGSEFDADDDALLGESPVEGSVVEGDLEVASEPVAKPVQAVPEVAVAPAAPPVSPEAAPPVASQPAAAPTVPVQPSQPPRSVAPSAADLAAWEGRQMQALEQHYQLSEDLKSAILTEPEVALPKILARAHMEITRSVVNATRNLMPSMFQEVTQSTRAEDDAKSTFYGANPDLAKPELEPVIMKLGAMYRQVNPHASAEEAVKRIGELVRVSVGLPAPVVAGGSSAPAASAPAVQRPFTPARGGAAPVAAKSDNAFTQLAEELFSDE